MATPTNQVQQLFQEFERYLDNVAKFGQTAAAAMAERLNQSLKNSDNRQQAAESLLKEFRPSDAVINGFINTNETAQSINKELLLDVFDQQAQNKTPRKQIDTKRQKLENEIQQELAGNNLKSHPMLEKMDKAIRDSILDVVRKTPANKNIDADRLTTAFDQARDTMENAARNEYKARLAMKMSPKRKIEGPRPT